MQTEHSDSPLGFTLVEMLVVVSIIVILSTLLYTYLIEARKESRDTFRADILEQLALGMKIIKEEGSTGVYPAHVNGVELGNEGALDASILTLYPEFVRDPLSTGGGSAYGYWYDSSFRCSGAAQVVLVAHLESANNSNYSSVCTASSPDAPPNSWPASEVYIKILQ